jgi:hypothetical protein
MSETSVKDLAGVEMMRDLPDFLARKRTTCLGPVLMARSPSTTPPMLRRWTAQCELQVATWRAALRKR